jgi:uncharacterized hydrophobic protein (TIGR00341 family)
MRIVEVVAPTRYRKELIGMARFYGALDVWCGPENADGRLGCRMLVPDDARQALMDALQSVLDREDALRIVVMPVDTALPRAEPTEKDREQQRRDRIQATREELYEQIARGARLDGTYLLLVVLSTVVAAIGMAKDNVAVIIGAMVIAPLLGPNIAFAFATSLGDRQLASRALLTASAGLGLALALTLVLGLVWPGQLAGPELMDRTEVGLDSVALALAAGAAAVLSLTTGVSSTLVGVMVAVALLPPAVAVGILLGSGRWGLAGGAALMLAVNVVCVLLAAKVVFLAKGVKPRGWLAQDRVKQSRALYIGLWLALLGVLVAIIVLRGPFAATAVVSG